VSFGAALGGVSSITSILMWLPQIVYTIRNRDGGSLSLVMLCIQMPGNLAAVYFQGLQKFLFLFCFKKPCFRNCGARGNHDV
jgi:uncharacterized protein with PQ loop repeat